MTDVAGDFVAGRTVVVGLFDPNCERLLGRGTGTCVSICGRYLVATAGHLFIGVPEPYCVGVMPLTTTPSREIFLATRHNRRGGGKTDPEDVAWLELSVAAARDLGREFLTLDGIEPHYAGAAGEPLFSYGFPEQEEITPKAHGQSEFGLSVQCYSTFVIPPTSIAPSCRRSTTLGAMGSSCCEFVVTQNFLRFLPTTPSDRINRSTRFFPTRLPCSRRARKTRGLP